MRWSPRTRPSSSRPRRAIDAADRCNAGIGGRRQRANRRRCAARLGGELSRRRHRYAGTRRPALGRPRARARPCRACGIGRAAPRQPTRQTRSRRLAERRLAHEPVARIIGIKEFWSFDLRIDAATLVPRPETETVVEAALAAIDDGGPRARELRIADLGTGSGAILLALLSELPNAFGVGSDIKPAGACRGARQCAALGLSRAAFVACDMAAAFCRTVRPDRLQSALHCFGRHRRTRARSAIVRSRAWRSTAAPTDLTFIGPLPRPRRHCSRPTACLVVELGPARREAVAAIICRCGACAVAAATRS